MGPYVSADHRTPPPGRFRACPFVPLGGGELTISGGEADGAACVYPADLPGRSEGNWGLAIRAIQTSGFSGRSCRRSLPVGQSIFVLPSTFKSFGTPTPIVRVGQVAGTSRQNAALRRSGLASLSKAGVGSDFHPRPRRETGRSRPTSTASLEFGPRPMKERSSGSRGTAVSIRWVPSSGRRWGPRLQTSSILRLPGPGNLVGIGSSGQVSARARLARCVDDNRFRGEKQNMLDPCLAKSIGSPADTDGIFFAIGLGYLVGQIQPWGGFFLSAVGRRFFSWALPSVRSRPNPQITGDRSG